MRFFLTKNPGLKLSAFLFAVALWFFVAGQSSTEVGFMVPLGFHGVPEDRAVKSGSPGEVEVRVRGPKFVINNISPRQITAELDLSGAKEGINTYNILPDDIVVPTGVKATLVRPSSVEVRVEGVLKAALPVKVRLTGRPARGYKVARLKVAPGRVEAVGRRSEIESIDRIYTEPVDVTGLAGSKSFTARLDIDNNEFSSISTDRVNVRVVIVKAD